MWKCSNVVQARKGWKKRQSRANHCLDEKTRNQTGGLVAGINARYSAMERAAVTCTAVKAIPVGCAAVGWCNTRISKTAVDRCH